MLVAPRSLKNLVKQQQKSCTEGMADNQGRDEMMAEAFRARAS